jgi:LacI family transcriptional regulator, gluconate utilization system Gnt-I transcriptional repressor
MRQRNPETSAKVNGRNGRRGTGRVRLIDVAKLAGVAPITVSRVINSPESVSPEMLQRVREAIDRTGYVPNLMAGGLASSRSRLVAAIVPSIASPVFQQTLAALTNTLAEAGYQLMLGESGYSESREDALIDAFIGRRPDGIVLMGIMRSAHGRLRLLGAGIPVVETWDLTPTPVDSVVGFSHEKIGVAVAEYLHDRGRRRPAVVTASDERARQRAAAFADMATRLGMAAAPTVEVPTFVAQAPGTFGSGRKGFAELLAQHQDIDAVFCSSDVLAFGVVTEAQVRGISIPGKLAIVGYGDLYFAADVVPPLTTVSVDAAGIGRLAARCIIDRAQGLPAEPRVTDVGFSIVRRESA